MSRYVLIGVGGVIGAIIGMMAASGRFGISPGLALVLVFVVVGVMAWMGLRNNKSVPVADDAARSRALAAPGDGSARLIVLREGFVAKLSGIDVLLDGAVVTQLKSPRFAALTVAPGRHRVEAKVAMQKTPLGPVELDLAAGEVAAVRISMEIGGGRIEREAWSPALRTRLESIPMVAA